MAIRLPQEQAKVQAQKGSNFRLQGAKGIKTDSSFLDTIEKRMESKSKQERIALEKRKKKQEDLVVVDFDNKAAKSRIIQTSEALSATGENAHKATSQGRQKLSENIDQITDEVAPQYRHLIEGRAGKHKLDFEKAAIPHLYKQSKDVEKQAYKTDTVNKMEDAVNSSNNDELFELSLKRVESASMRAGRNEFGDETPEAAKLVKRGSDLLVSSTILKAIEQKSSLLDVTGAKGTQKKFGDRLSNDDKVEAQKIIDRAQKDFEDEIAWRNAKAALAKHPNDEAARTKMLQKTSTTLDQFRDSHSMSKDIAAVQVRRSKKEMNDLVSSKYDQADKFMDENIAPHPRFYKGLNPQDRKELRKYITEGGNVVTDPQTYDNLYNLWANDPETFFNTNVTNLRTYKGSIGRKDLEKLESLQKNGISARHSAEGRVKSSNDNAVKDVVNGYMAKNNVFVEAEKYAVRKLAMDAYAELKDVPGIKIQEIRQRVHKALNDSKVAEKLERNDSNSFLGFKYNQEEITPLKPNLEPVQRGQFRAHPSVINAMQAARQRAGKPPLTAADIQKRLTRMSNTVDVTKPFTNGSTKKVKK